MLVGPERPSDRLLSELEALGLPSAFIRKEDHDGTGGQARLGARRCGAFARANRENDSQGAEGGESERRRDVCAACSAVRRVIGGG